MNKETGELKKIKGSREKEISHKFYFICSLVTVMAMIMILVEFFSRGAFSVSRISPFYIGILLIYSLHKELIRWIGERRDRRGERFVFIWIGMALILYLIDFFTQGFFTQTSEGKINPVLENLNMITLEVGVIFLLTKFMKVVRKLAEKRFKI